MIRDERGSVSIIVVAIVAVIVVLGLCAADLARVLTVSASAQSAADAAALAAAQELAVPSGVDPSEMASEYAVRNGAELVSCTCERGSLAATVDVRVPVGPLRVFGDDRVVGASARAIVDPPGDP